ncbi:hypothetical protein F4680DRAFT_409850 [Xylaria scruposa]|nr:hypothetical protein F4680DRAFT_409850 [Xylaria scruposa]
MINRRLNRQLFVLFVSFVTQGVKQGQWSLITSCGLVSTRTKKKVTLASSAQDQCCWLISRQLSTRSGLAIPYSV